MARLNEMEERLHKRVIGQDAGDRGHRQRRAPRARRAAGSQPADRLVHLPRPDRRGQDRAGARAGRVPVRRRDAHGAHRHVASTWRSTRCRASSARLPATSATTRAASSPRRCAAVPTRWCCSTRSKRRTPTCSTCCSQVLDDGRLTDGQGRTVDFKNTVIIMTSNVGSQFIRDVDDVDRPDVREQIDKRCARSFKPEFLNRVDEIIVFHKLGAAELGSSSTCSWRASQAARRARARRSSCRPRRSRFLARARLRAGVRRAAAQARDPALPAGSAGQAHHRRRLPAGRHHPRRAQGRRDRLRQGDAGAPTSTKRRKIC